MNSTPNIWVMMKMMENDETHRSADWRRWSSDGLINLVLNSGSGSLVKLMYSVLVSLTTLIHSLIHLGLTPPPSPLPPPSLWDRVCFLVLLSLFGYKSKGDTDRVFMCVSKNVL